MKKKLPSPLYENQNEAVEHLLRRTAAGDVWVPLAMPTAGGKTVSVQVALQKLADEKLLVRGVPFRGALVLVPRTDIETSWVDCKVWLYTDPGALEPQAETVAIDEKLYVALRDDDRARAEFLNTFKPTTGMRVAVTTHAHVAKRFNAMELPTDLSGWVVVVDEAHHLGHDGNAATNRNREVVDHFVAHGAVIWPVTATPFRSNDQILWPEEVSPRVWSYSQLAAQSTVPRNVVVRTIALEQEGRVADALLDSDYTKVSDYVKDLDIPVVIRIAPGRKQSAWMVAERLKQELVRRGIRESEIFNAIGETLTNEDDEDVEVSKALAERLREERKIAGSARGYHGRTLRVVLVCGRMLEGSDWPMCAAVVSLGTSVSPILVTQLLGRAARRKRHIKNYPKAWVDRVLYTAFVPKIDPDDLTKEEARAHLQAALLECSEVTASYYGYWARLAQSLRLPQVTQARRAWLAEAREALVLPADQEVDAHIEAIGIALGQRDIFGTPPTLEKMFEVLREHQIPPKQIHAVLMGAVYNTNPEGAEEALIALKEAIEERASRNDVTENRYVKQHVRDILWEKLLSLAERYGSMLMPLDEQFLERTGASTGASTGVECLFTADSLRTMVRRLVVDRNDAHDYSDVDTITKIIDPYKATFNGRVLGRESCPCADAGHCAYCDLGPLVGTKYSLRDLKASRRRRGLLPVSHLALVPRSWVFGPDLDPEAVERVLAAGLATRLLRRLDSQEFVSALSASHDRKLQTTISGRTENLFGLKLALRYGWRGLGRALATTAV